jgi:hypothetical protein
VLGDTGAVKLKTTDVVVREFWDRLVGTPGIVMNALVGLEIADA